MDCIFCKIAAKSVPAEILCETEEVLGFKDIDPQAPFHAVVVFKSHWSKVDALCVPWIGRLVAAATRLGEQHCPGGYRVAFNTGKDACQTVDHAHVHVVGGAELGPICQVVTKANPEAECMKCFDALRDNVSPFGKCPDHRP